MNRPFRTEPEASAELEYSAVCHESRRPGLGVEFLEAVNATLERIARWRQAARRIPCVSSDILARKAPVKGFRYHIAYLVMSDTIRVLPRPPILATKSGVTVLEPTNLRVVFATHLHSDHTVGCPDLILTPRVLGGRISLEVYGPPGINAMADHILRRTAPITKLG